MVKELIIQNTEIFINNNLILKIKDINFKVGINIIQGENGTGKSSFFNAFFKKKDFILKGFINILPDYDNLTTHEIVKKGFCLIQQENLFVDNLTYDVLWNSIIDNFKLDIKLDDIYNIFPLALEKKFTIVGSNSGGENRMLELVSLMLLKPNYIFLDEIDSGLSIKHKDLLLNILNFFQNSVIIIITHDPNLINKLNNVNLLSCSSNTIENVK